MYEIFVLGELMTGDKHGYMLQEILKMQAGLTVRSVPERCIRRSPEWWITGGSILVLTNPAEANAPKNLQDYRFRTE